MWWGRQGRVGEKREREIGGAQGIFREVKLLCKILKCWIHILHLSKFTECTQRVDTNVKYGLQLIVIYQYCLSNCYKQITSMQDINNRTNDGGGEREYMETVLSAHSANLKLF